MNRAPHVVSGHQPVYLPWLGLFHKIALCDTFVIMDDVQYLRQDWNNRNRLRGPHGPLWVTVPVSLKASRCDRLSDTRIAEHPADWQVVHWKTLRMALAGTPYWKDHADALEQFYLGQRWTFLRDLCVAQLTYFLDALGLAPRILLASEQGFVGRKSDLVLDHARRTEADVVVFGQHGRDYVRLEDFEAASVGVLFQDYRHPVYPQRFAGPFMAGMSIIDLLCNVGPDSLSVLLSGNVTRASLDAAWRAAGPRDLSAMLAPAPGNAP